MLSTCIVYVYCSSYSHSFILMSAAVCLDEDVDVASVESPGYVGHVCSTSYILL